MVYAGTEQVLSLDWLHKRHGVTLDAVGHHRDRRQLHGELPVNYALHVLGRSLRRYCRWRCSDWVQPY